MYFRNCIFIAVCCAYICAAQLTVESRGLMENIDYGIKYAGKLFGINTAADVAELVTSAFKQTNRIQADNDKTQDSSSSTEYNSNEPKQQQKPANDIFAFSRPQLLTAFLRMIGFDVNKLGALAINALIFLAQTIGSNLISHTNTPNVQPNERQSRAMQMDSPIDWFLKSPTTNMNQLLYSALDANLTQRLQNIVKTEKNSEKNSNCLKILLCRSAPFIKSMQESLKKNLDLSEVRIMAKRKLLNDTSTSNSQFRDLYANMPTLMQYEQQVNICKQTYGNSCF